jgi:GNAT superfamily N-acetyltransferase
MATANPPPSKPTWRPLTLPDLTALIRIADQIHPDLPERPAIFAERITLFPHGCLALVLPSTNELCGYAISHPIRGRAPPALDILLGALAPGADQYYIHDVAILPAFQGQGLAQEGVERLLCVAEGFATAGLMSVYGTKGFWGRFGFEEVRDDEGVERKVRAYGEGAVFLERRNGGAKVWGE